MTRLGWSILTAILVLAGAFVSMTSFGIAPEQPQAVPIRRAAPPDAGTLLMPVAGVARSAIADSWGDPRGGGTREHRGTDIMAAANTPVVAAAAGTVEKLFQSAQGGTTLYLRSADRRWTYYYAHLSGYAVGVREGLRVGAGDVIGFVGDTGDAGAGNYHLHFSISRMAPGQRWWEGEDVNPYPLLASARLPG